MSNDNLWYSEEDFQAEMARITSVLDGYEAPYKAALLQICEQIGYGRVMQLSSQMWQEKDPIGSFVVGTCKISTVPCGCNDGSKPFEHCDWCCGCGWLTEHVKQIKDKS